MKRLICVAVAIGALVQGCAFSSPAVTHLGPGDTPQAMPVNAAAGETNTVSAITLTQPGRGTAHGDEVGPGKQTPVVEGHPLTSVVVTQCNLVVAVYMTMPDGRLLRFDKNTNVPAEELVAIAYTATRSERVEVSCDGMGAAGYETHGATTSDRSDGPSVHGSGSARSDLIGSMDRIRASYRIHAVRIERLTAAFKRE
jgi:hypothetical protein